MGMVGWVRVGEDVTNQSHIRRERRPDPGYESGPPPTEALSGWWDGSATNDELEMTITWLTIFLWKRKMSSEPFLHGPIQMCACAGWRTERRSLPSSPVNILILIKVIIHNLSTKFSGYLSWALEKERRHIDGQTHEAVQAGPNVSRPNCPGISHEKSSCTITNSFSTNTTH